MNIEIVLPSLVALFIKLGFLYYVASRKINVNKVLIALLVSFCLLNLAEFLTYFDQGQTLWNLKLYYVFAIASLILMTALIMEITGFNPHIFLLVHLAGMIIGFLIIFSDLIIKDFISIDYSITRVKGQHYGLFAIFAIIELVTSIVLVCWKTFDRKESMTVTRAKSGVILAALLPVLFSTLIVVYLMNAGFNVNAAVITPITTTIFLWGCVYAVRSNSIVDLSIFMPFSPSWKNRKNLMYFFYASEDKSQMWSHLMSLEKSYIEEAIKEQDGKITRAAKALGYTPGKLEYRAKEIHNLK